MARNWPKLPRGAETYSVTALRDWECLYRGKAKRIDRRKEAVSPQLHEGRILHDVAARYIEHCLALGVPTDLSVMPALVKGVFFDPEAEEPHSLPVERVAEIERIACRWAENTIIDIEHTAAVEEIWVPQVADLTPAPYFYVICDHVLIDGDWATIRDLKSDRHLRTTTDVATDFQVLSYCWGVAQQFPHVRNFRVQMDFLRHGVVREVEYGPSVIEAAHNMIVAGIERVREYKQRSKFPAIAGDGCAWCGFQSECPILRAETDPTVIQGPEDAAAAAAALHVVEARRNKLRGLLAEWTAQGGPVAVGKTSYGHHLKRSETIDEVPEAVERLEAIGMGADAWDALRFDREKLGRLLRDPKAGPKLEDLVVDASHTEFAARKEESA